MSSELREAARHYRRQAHELERTLRHLTPEERAAPGHVDRLRRDLRLWRQLAAEIEEHQGAVDQEAAASALF